MKFSKLLIVDPSLANTIGHHYEYAKSVYDAARQRGLETAVVCHRDANDIVRTTLKAYPVFRMSMYQKSVNMAMFPTLSKRITSLLFIIRFLWDWHTVQSSLRLTAETVVFIPTCTEVNALALIIWMRMRRSIHRPPLICLLRYDPRFTMKWIGKFARTLASRKQIIFTTDSEALAQEYQKRSQLTFQVLPIPHIPKFLSSNSEPSEEKKQICLTYLGTARLEKGFDVLVEAIALLEQDILNHKIRFVVQCNTFLQEPEIEKAKEVLERLSYAHQNGIRLIRESLSTEEYYKLLINSDVIIIPARKSQYYARTSGILMEAYAAGKPTVVADGTWLSHMVRQYGGGIIFEDGNSKDLARAIKQMAVEFEQYRHSSLLASKEIRKTHSAERLLELLLSYSDTEHSTVERQ